MMMMVVVMMVMVMMMMMMIIRTITFPKVFTIEKEMHKPAVLN